MKNICSVLYHREKCSKRSSKVDIEKYLDWKTSKLSTNNGKYLSGNTSKTIFFIEFSPDGNIFASSHGQEHCIKIFDSHTRKLLQNLRGHPRTPWTAAFHPRINFLLASGCLGGEVRLWNFQPTTRRYFNAMSLGSMTYSCCRGSILYTSTETITSVSFHPHDDVLVFGTSNMLCFLDWNNKCLLRTIKTGSREECVRFAKFQPTTGALITGVSTKYLEQNRYVRSYRLRNRRSSQSTSETNQGVEAMDTSESTDDDDNGNETDDSSASNDETSFVLRLNFTPQSLGNTGSASSSTSHNNNSDGENRLDIFNTFYELYLRLSCVTSVNFRKTLCRLQIWQSNDKELPNLCDTELNVIGQLCRIRHESSCNISRDGSMIAYFEPNLESSSGRHDFERDLILKIISLQKENYLQCIYTRKYGQNAICVSLSPTNQYVLVGLATPKVVWQPTSQQLVGSISEIQQMKESKVNNIDESKASLSVIHQSKDIPGSGISINAMVFHPHAGNGVLYGTNKGNIYHSHILYSLFAVNFNEKLKDEVAMTGSMCSISHLYDN